MAFEDLFGGKSVISPEANIVNNPNPNAMNQEKGFFETFFSDPNIIRGMGEAGSAISSGQPIGQSVGDFASNLTRRRAVQEGARQSRTEQKTFQEKMLEAIMRGTALSPKDQNDAFDSFTLDGDGGMSFSMKNTPQKQGFARNPALESMRSPSTGGNDLPNFSNQSSEGAFDFAGLDSEDIGMLLNAEQQFGKLSQNQAKMLLDEKARRSAAIAANKQRTEDLRLLAQDRAEKKRQFNLQQGTRDKKSNLDSLKLQLDQLKEVNREELNPTELEAHNAEIALKQAQAKALTSGKPLTAKEKIDAAIAERKIRLAEQKGQMQLDDFSTKQFDFITDSEGDFEQRKQAGDIENARPGNRVVYVEGTKENRILPDKPVMNAIPIPEGLTVNGKPMTGSEIIKRAAQANMTVEEFLAEVMRRSQ